MSVSEMRRQRKAKAAEALAAGIVAKATAKVVAARPSPAPSPQGDPMAQAMQVKQLRDGGMAWWVIGQQLGLAQPATSASDPEAKRGAGRARSLYAAANRGEVPRTNAPRKGSTPKPTGPGRGGTVTMRKQMLVDQGHVIPRDMSCEEVEALVRGRTIEWAIDLARLTKTDPTTWGPDDKRYMTEDARVHVDGKWIYAYEDEETGDRILRFREYAGRDDRGNHMSGPTRTVRVDAIFTIR